MVTARFGSVSLSLRMKSTRKVRSSSATNCSGFSSEPAAICVVAKPPIETARSSDHLTSLAVTGRPEWNFASRSRKVQLMPSEASCQLSASSGSSSVMLKVCAGAVGQRHRLEAHQPVVAVQRDAVHGLRGTDALHVEAVRPVFLDQEQRLGAARAALAAAARAHRRWALRAAPRARTARDHHCCLGLDERPVVEPAVEPVLVAGHVLLHRDVT